MKNNTLALKVTRCVVLQITQAEMAKELGVSLRTYSRWESKGAPDRVLKHVVLLADLTQRARGFCLDSANLLPASERATPQDNLAHLIG